MNSSTKEPRDITERERSKKALRESESRYRSLFLASADAIMTLEPPTWKFTSCNPATVRMFGARGEAEFVSREPWALSPEYQPDGRPSDAKAVEMIETALRDGSHFFEWTHRRFGGEDFPATVLLTRMTHSDGQFLQATVRDITERKRLAKEVLNQSERMFRALTDKSPLAIYIYSGEEQKADYINPTYLRLFGYTFEEIPCAADWWRHAYPDPEYRAQVSAEWYRRAAHSLETNTAFEPMECRVRCKDGSDKIIAWGFSRVGHQNVAWGIDLTEHKRAEEALREAEEMFALFMNHSPIYTFIKEVTPSESRVLQASENYREMVGVAGSDMVGKTMPELFPAEFAAKITADDWTVVSGGEVLKLDEELHGRTYTTIKFPLCLRGKTLLAGYTIDITDLKRAMEEREDLLSREQAARLQAEAALRDRDEFLAIGAHELKTPLAALKIQVEGMRKLLERDNMSPSVMRKGFDIASRQVERLVRLVTVLLEITRIRTGRLEIQRRACDLVVVTREVLSRHQAALLRAGCEADYSGPEVIPGNWDADRLEQVIENLIGNAMKFASGTRIEIRGDVTPGAVRLTVRDGGPGLPPAILERIFEPYERGGSGELHRGGLGMGLFISREIIQKHDGTIRAENAEGGGLLFTIDLPRNEA